MQSLSSVKKDSWLSWFLKGIMLLGFIVMIGRMIELQIIKGDYFRVLAESNRIRRVPITAPRGDILSRDGQVLVGNEEIEPGRVWKRTYPLKANFSHLSGYLGSVGEEEIGKVEPLCPEKGPLRSEALVGRGGLEQQYSCQLRGIDGEELIEVDTFGKKIRALGSKDALAGSSIKTTIDLGLQNQLAKIFNEKEIKADQSKNKKRLGAVVVSDLEGNIMALYSAPSFDPSVFIEGNSEEVGKLLTDKSLPLFNRAFGGAFHPGSVFKMVTTAAGLEEGKLSSDFVYDDPGVITINEFSYANWLFTKYGRTEGAVTLRKALARSTDTFYYKIGEFLGADILASWARRFGYGQKTGIKIPGETEGLIPDPAWKKEVKKENWFLGNTYHMAIGQGDVTATPLQVTAATVALANGGKLCQPRLVSSEPAECRTIGLSQATQEEIKQGMIEACSPGGTAVPFFNFEPKVACKTGTAETEEENKTHAWFTVWGPVNSEDSTMSQIAVTVLVEKGGEGSEVAAPIARDIFDYWFYERNP